MSDHGLATAAAGYAIDKLKDLLLAEVKTLSLILAVHAKELDQQRVEIEFLRARLVKLEKKI